MDQAAVLPSNCWATLSPLLNNWKAVSGPLRGVRRKRNRVMMMMVYAAVLPSNYAGCDKVGSM